MSFRSAVPGLDTFLSDITRRVRSLERGDHLVGGTLSMKATRVGDMHLSHDGPGLLVANKASGDSFHVYRLEKNFSTDGPLTASISGPWKPPAGSVLAELDITLGDAGLGRTFTDGAVTAGSRTFTSATASFDEAYDNGLLTASSAIPSGTRVQAVLSPTSLTMSAPASASASGLSTVITSATKITMWKGVGNATGNNFQLLCTAIVPPGENEVKVPVSIPAGHPVTADFDGSAQLFAGVTYFNGGASQITIQCNFD